MKYKSTKYFTKKRVKYEFTTLLELLSIVFKYICLEHKLNLVYTMKENPYAKMTLEELQSQAKTVKIMMAIFSGILLVLMFSAVFLGIQQDFYALSFIPIALFPVFFVILNNLHNIQEEIKCREN